MALAVATSLIAPRARAQSTARAIPALAARIGDPADGRRWSVATRLDERELVVTAAAPGTALAVTLRRHRQGHPGCRETLAEALHVDDPAPLRTDAPEVFTDATWERGEVYRQSGDTHDGEFACLRVGPDAWVATALARPRAGVSLADAAPMARRLAFALADPRTRRGYPLRLEVSRLEIDDPSDGAPWLFTGAAEGFPLPSDAVSSNAGSPGGVTLTIARRPGSCVEAWNALRPGITAPTVLVDRPGYVPALYGARVRRATMGDRSREIYCLGTARGATVITAVFGANDADAMARMTPMLRVVSSAVAREALAGGR